MSTTPTAPASTDGANGMMAGLTTVHLIVLAVLAVVVVIAIIYGAYLKAQRRAAEHDERDRIAEFEATPSPSPRATPDIDAPPVAPAPPTESLASPDVPITAADVFVATPPVADHVQPITPRDEPVVHAPVSLFVAPSAPAPAGSTLTVLKGLGPKVAVRLGELGITRLDQMAALDEDAAEAVDAQLGPFRGRLTRDRWVEQARFLAADDRAGFEAVFGKL